ncbi:Aste57867_6927 [Aphanomyces stellatus]|uniref:Aste57867_6927 protein n=1 Tax=Aphanomyces stellatus TaxID=120398 RepID=A0A485KHS0_9STRA|nr:hypothetical protein As57867_006905 [Aphanomyces stellatus]VFT83879.1 Aste57867_6927 [Aphanomyces stellatus]
MSQSTPVDPSVQVAPTSENASLLHGGQAAAAGKTKLIVLGVAAVAAVGTGIYFIAKPSTASAAIVAPVVGDGFNATSTTTTVSPSTTLSPVATSMTPVVSTTTAAVVAQGPPTSDPEAMTPALTLLAIGDWGSTTGKQWGVAGSCCHVYNGQVDKNQPRYMVDYYSQNYVATLMAQSAVQLKPKPARIVGHGDNFYWNGIGPADAAYRFQETFEKMYNQPELAGIKWINVIGNHDIGGSSYICGEQDNQFRECASTDEMIKYLRSHFDLQAKYKSPNQDRWVMKDHYYVERVTQNGVTVDIFNLDTNHADSHGARQVCCQCYGYSAKFGVSNANCNNVNGGDQQCMGGNVDMFNACMNEIEAWATDSYTQALRDMAASSADFKIINTHYSPHHHMAPAKMQKWYDLTKDMGITAWFNGHTHGFSHDISTWGTHFFENGGGGGIYTDSDSATNNGFVSNKWVGAGTPYGYMELSFSKDWLKVQFATFDKAWTFGGMDMTKTVPGGIQRGHCWYIPHVNATGPGVECKASINYAVGAPLR